MSVAVVWGDGLGLEGLDSRVGALRGWQVRWLAGLAVGLTAMASRRTIEVEGGMGFYAKSNHGCFGWAQDDKLFVM
jgi:hypothetical protein